MLKLGHGKPEVVLLIQRNLLPSLVKSWYWATFYSENLILFCEYLSNIFKTSAIFSHPLMSWLFRYSFVSLFIVFKASFALFLISTLLVCSTYHHNNHVISLLRIVTFFFFASVIKFGGKIPYRYAEALSVFPIISSSKLSICLSISLSLWFFLPLFLCSSLLRVIRFCFSLTKLQFCLFKCSSFQHLAQLLFFHSAKNSCLS